MSLGFASGALLCLLAVKALGCVYETNDLQDDKSDRDKRTSNMKSSMPNTLGANLLVESEGEWHNPTAPTFLQRTCKCGSIFVVWYSEQVLLPAKSLASFTFSFV